MAPGVARQRFPWGRYALAGVAVAVLAALPLISAITASLAASLAGCTLDEGSVRPCVIAGADVGDTLYTMFVLGWLMLVTLPAGAALLAALVVVALIHFVLSRFRARSL